MNAVLETFHELRTLESQTLDNIEAFAMRHFGSAADIRSQELFSLCRTTRQLAFAIYHAMNSDAETAAQATRENLFSLSASPEKIAEEIALVYVAFGQEPPPT